VGALSRSNRSAGGALDTRRVGNIEYDGRCADVVCDTLSCGLIVVGNHHAPAARGHEAASRLADAVASSDHHHQALACRSMNQPALDSCASTFSTAGRSAMRRR
jgi:hypothetical protein